MLKKLLASGIAAAAFGAAAPAIAAPPPPYSWAGLYAGTHSGAAWGQANVADPFGPSIFGDKVTTPAYLFGGQIGFNWQSFNWVWGVQADLSLLSSDGSNTCGQFSPLFVGWNCHDKPRAFGTLTGRVGTAVGPYGRTLIYGKGGAAWIDNDLRIETNNLFFGGGGPQPPAANSSYSKWGWTLGVGVQQALTPAWSLSLEYDYLGFGSATVATPPSIVVSTAGLITAFVPAGTTSVSEHFHVVKLGLNYKFGADPWARWDGAPVLFPVKAPMRGWDPGWEFDVGARYWYSSGKFQWDNFAAPGQLESRLTYDRLTANAGELFGRIDTPWQVFVKGNIGAGRIGSGHMNDEDWGLFAAVPTSYTNTISDPVTGPLRYATVDVGFAWLRGPTYKYGPFVGYNYFREAMHAFGCTQISQPLSGICVPAFPSSVESIVETATWRSVRLGVSGEAMWSDRLKVSGEVAYLPYVDFVGRDNHLLRAVPTWFDQKGTGRGVQAEIILSYLVTDQFSVGVGGRYWAMWTTNGSFHCTGCGGAGVVSADVPGKYNTERFGVFLQANYKFGASGR